MKGRKEEESKPAAPLSAWPWPAGAGLLGWCSERAPCDLTLQSAPLCPDVICRCAQVTDLSVRDFPCTPSPQLHSAPRARPEGPEQGHLDFGTAGSTGRVAGTGAACRGSAGESNCCLGPGAASGLQMALAGDAVLELHWGWPFLPSWPPGFHPWQQELLGWSSQPSSPPVLSAWWSWEAQLGSHKRGALPSGSCAGA